MQLRVNGQAHIVKNFVEVLQSKLAMQTPVSINVNAKDRIITLLKNLALPVKLKVSCNALLVLLTFLAMKV